MNNDISDVDNNTDDNVDMAITIGQVSLKDDIQQSFWLLQELTFDVRYRLVYL